jgi:hypothetical protein
MVLATLGPDDAGALLALTQGIGWPHTLEDWRTMLTAGEVFGHRTREGDVVSSAALFPYDGALTSIGMVIVRRDRRGEGLAKALMLHCLDRISPPKSPVMLIATADGYPLYDRLGFRTVDEVHRLRTTAGVASDPARLDVPGHDLATLVHADLGAVHRLDTEAYGVERRRVLGARAAQAARGTVLRRADGRLVGFALGTLQRDLLVVGPVVAPDAQAAVGLVVRTAAGHRGPVRVDAPARHPALIAALTALGFHALTVQPLMLRNATALPGRRDCLFGLTFAAFG